MFGLVLLPLASMGQVPGTPPNQVEIRSVAVTDVNGQADSIEIRGVNFGPDAATFWSKASGWEQSSGPTR